MSAEDKQVFRLRVLGTEDRPHSNMTWPFDETYELEAEHPSPAIEQLLHEVEWSILDTSRPFTIEVAPKQEWSA